jgi:hypothetical protein
MFWINLKSTILKLKTYVQMIETKTNKNNHFPFFLWNFFPTWGNLPSSFNQKCFGLTLKSIIFYSTNYGVKND